jgi:hypothetical protein
MERQELDHKVREHNQKRQILQREHQTEMTKTQALMRDLDEKITQQHYERQALQLKERREQLVKELETLKKGQQEPKNSQ